MHSKKNAPASRASKNRTQNNGRKAAAKASRTPESETGTTSPDKKRDTRPLDRQLDQYYTKRVVALLCYLVFLRRFGLRNLRLVEPSAGDGAFLELFPADRLAYDIDPRCEGIEQRDFLGVELPTDQPLAFVGNPPFGRCCETAIAFFNHAAAAAKVIAFVLPRTFRKPSIQNRLDRNFHLVEEIELPADAFLFRGRPYDVPAVFQIWEWREEPRPAIPVVTEHPDFVFTTADQADFVIQRVGARAGRIHHDFTVSGKSHYFIRGDVLPIMRQLDLATPAGDVAGNPSLSKAEIVALYSARKQAIVDARRRSWRRRGRMGPDKRKYSGIGMNRPGKSAARISRRARDRRPAAARRRDRQAE